MTAHTAAAVLAALRHDACVSGSALAARLGVTRAAVWKQVHALRALGAPIESAPGRGYRLGWPIQLLQAAAIRRSLSPVQRAYIGIEVRWQLDSTNSQLLRRAATSDADSLACLTEIQSAGRGRRGRAWIAPLGGAICLSFLKRFAAGMGSLGGLSLAAGVAVVETLHAAGFAQVGLKWPNDVVLADRKLAGILVEIGGEFLGPCHAVIGLGLNLRVPPAHALDQPVAALEQLSGPIPSRNALAAQLIGALDAATTRFAGDGFAAFAERFARHDALAGRRVRVHAEDDTAEGVACGVDARGALRVRQGERMVTFDSAEVSVRPA